jgi:hypothetical protein
MYLKLSTYHRLLTTSQTRACHQLLRTLHVRTCYCRVRIGPLHFCRIYGRGQCLKPLVCRFLFCARVHKQHTGRLLSASRMGSLQRAGLLTKTSAGRSICSLTFGLRERTPPGTAVPLCTLHGQSSCSLAKLSALILPWFYLQLGQVLRGYQEALVGLRGFRAAVAAAVTRHRVHRHQRKLLQSGSGSTQHPTNPPVM